MLAVVLAVGLLIVGGVALWGALNKDSSSKAATPPSSPSVQPTGKKSSSGATSGDYTVQIRCLAAQCPLYVANAGGILFNNHLVQGDTRTYEDIRLTVVTDDASTVQITINGQVQPRGKPRERRTYQLPKS